MAPLYCCVNAFKPTESCVYTLCSSCHLENEKGKGRSSRRGKDVDKDKNMCDHNNLQVVTDTLYFNESYLMTCVQNDDKMPLKCSKCRGFFRN